MPSMLGGDLFHADAQNGACVDVTKNVAVEEMTARSESKNEPKRKPTEQNQKTMPINDGRGLRTMLLQEYGFSR